MYSPCAPGAAQLRKRCQSSPETHSMLQPHGAPGAAEVHNCAAAMPRCFREAPSRLADAPAGRDAVAPLAPVSDHFPWTRSDHSAVMISQSASILSHVPGLSRAAWAATAVCSRSVALCSKRAVQSLMGLGKGLIKSCWQVLRPSVTTRRCVVSHCNHLLHIEDWVEAQEILGIEPQPEWKSCSP